MAELVDAPDVSTVGGLAGTMLFPVASADGGTLYKATGAEIEAFAGGGGGVDAWTALTFSGHSTTYGTEFLVSDQTFTVADGDRMEAEGALDSVGNGASNSGQNGIGWLVGDSLGLLSFLDQNANRSLGQLTGGSFNVLTYTGSGLQQGGGAWALTHSLAVQTSKVSTGTCECAYGGAGAGAQAGYMVGQEMAGTARVLLWCRAGTPQPYPLWVRGRLRKAGS